MRILVTGSRDWNAVVVLEEAFFDYNERYSKIDKPAITLVSGHCPTGADFLAERLASTLGWNVELHPADWTRYGKRAGFVRNKEMVDLGADLCLAFIKNNSKGASMTAEMAQKAGIETRIWRA